MDAVEVDTVGTAELEEPVLVEGLPGVGHVGKLAAEHLVEEFDGTAVRKLYSEHLPPQVTVTEEGRTELACATVHAVETGGTDLLVLTGDHQAQDTPGHYRLTEAVLDVAESFGVTGVYALGGVPTGELIEEYDVLGAATADELIDSLEAVDVSFRAAEPAGGIVGTSGLLLGLGERRGVDAACLMGETSGYLVDPKSAQAVIEVLEAVLDFDVDVERLEERAEEMEEVVGTLQEMEEAPNAPAATEDDLRYIG